MLDAERGGFWQIVPDGPYHVRQTYRDRTNILDTIFVTPTGMVTVTDFMPAYYSSMKQHARLHNEPRVIRLVQCSAGKVRMRHRFHPRPQFGRSDVAFSLDTPRMLHADVGTVHLCMDATVDLQTGDHDFEIGVGEAAAFSLRSSRVGAHAERQWSVELALRSFRETRRFWWQWVGQIRYDGPYQERVTRSALALKLMTYSPTGAIVAAPTTSLPELIGGDRNWDYRFTWLRDASFTLYSFFQLDLQDEAEDFFQWLVNRHLAEGMTRVPNLFDLSGRRRSNEIELTHLSGYRNSRPVRTGNAATKQLQLDVYGEVLDTAYIYARFGGGISRSLWKELRNVVDLAIKQWELPDSSIWEVRSPPRHFTYSKMMCWVAVDRGLRMAEHFGLPHDAATWRAARRAIHQRVIREAWNPHMHSFAQTLGGDTYDASLLRMSTTRFLPARDPRMAATVHAIERNLATGVMVRRYHPERSPDGLEGGEGAFFMTSFWLVDALAHVGDLENAERRFELLQTFGSPVGLFSEEVDATTGHLLGNYPQAFTHLALVGAAVNIERARARRLGVHGLKPRRQRALGTRLVHA